MPGLQPIYEASPPSPGEQEQLRADMARASFARDNLGALGALLDIDGSDNAYAAMFAAIDKVFGFDRAMVLEEADDAVRCIAAAPAELVGRRWTGVFFHGVLDGRVLVAESGHRPDDWADVPHDLAAPEQPALCLPVGIGGRRAALLLLRMAGQPRFSDGHVATARQCAVVTLAALAAHASDKLESEIARLNNLVEQMRQNGRDTGQGASQGASPDSEQVAGEGGNLLREVIDVLPSSLTVQDEEGRFVLVNAVAAANLAMPADRLIGVALPALPSTDGVAEPKIEAGTREESVASPSGPRTWLTSRNPVVIGGKKLMVSSAYDITERKAVEDELTQRAYFDELTGLPNRLLIQGHVEDVLRRSVNGRKFALAFIDLDNFKHINDYYSHAIGDALLVKVAQRIGERLRDSDVLSRISGDEFLLIINPVENDEEVRTIINHLIDDLKDPFHVEAFEIFTSASIGVSFYPSHGTTYEALRRNADNAMYRAKGGTKGHAIYFDMAMGKTITARMEHEQRLRLAIRDRRFCCAFQPKVDIHTGAVAGFETLVRWRDDDGEIHSPGTFVGLAVELGLIDPITHFVLEETVRSMERLDEAFGPGTTISLNVAAKQAGDVKFMRSFVDAIRASGCAERIMVELTEDAFVAKSLFQTQILPMLRDAGVRVSIDDFGTGYSSLSVLSEITADELKVDRSFITDIHQRPRSQSILRTIESLGHALGMSIIAEGVESDEELAYLHAATHIRYAQGYYFSKPFFLDDMPAKRMSDSGREFEATRDHIGRRKLHGRGLAAES